MKGKLFPASRSLFGLGLLSSSSSRWLPSALGGFLSLLSAMRLSMFASDSGVKGLKLSGPGGASSRAAIFSSCSNFVSYAASRTGQLWKKQQHREHSSITTLKGGQTKPSHAQPLFTVSATCGFFHDMVIFLFRKSVARNDKAMFITIPSGEWAAKEIKTRPSSELLAFINDFDTTHHQGPGPKIHSIPSMFKWKKSDKYKYYMLSLYVECKNDKRLENKKKKKSRLKDISNHWFVV